MKLIGRSRVTALLLVFAMGFSWSTGAGKGSSGLDPGFGYNGASVISLSGGADMANAVVLQPDGKIVTAGYLYNPSIGDHDIAVIRLNPDGSVDGSFNSDGIFWHPHAGDDYGLGLALRPDGKIIVAGTTISPSTFDADFALLQLNADGSPDPTFGSSGFLPLAAVGTSEYVRSVTIQPDGKIILTGWMDGQSSIDFHAVRLNSDGTLDPSFSGDGKVTLDITGSNDHTRSAALQADGKLVIGGWADHGIPGAGDIFLARLNANGSLDSSFAGDGILQFSTPGVNETLQDLAIQPDGKIIAVGRTDIGGSGTDFMAIRLLPTGNLDTAFDSDGTMIFIRPTTDENANTLTIGPDGEIVLAGTLIDAAGRDFAVLKLRSNGSPNFGFGSGGMAVIDLGSPSDELFGVAIQPDDGKIVIAGGTYEPQYDMDSVVARLLPGLGDALFLPLVRR